jgi:S1-C subfamily serine protease
MISKIQAQFNRRSQALILWLLAATLLFSAALLHKQVYAIERAALNQALLATVQVIVPVADEDDLYSTGSGTVLSEDGLILTNFHVMGDMDTGLPFNADGFAGIAVNPTNLRSAPILKYAAVMINGDPELDLALLRIVGLLEETNAPLPTNLGLTTVTIGDSELLEIGDEINAFGFPGIGGDTVTFTSGRLSGFLDEDKDGYSEWLKVDLNINRGNSGGLATNELGEMIGVPTAGRSDLGMLGLVRDGNLAMDFVKRSLLQAQTGGPATTTGPYINKVQFARAINAKGRALNPGVRFSSGTEAIYATFDYGNFTDNGNFEFAWYQDGFRIYRDVVVWANGRDGSSWVNVYNEDGLEDGFYEVELKLNGNSLYRNGILIGEGRAGQRGSFGPITFAEGITNDDRPLNPGTLFSQIDEVYAFFDVYEIANGAKWSRRWYLDNEIVSEQQAIWSLGPLDYSWLSLYADNGLPEGYYRLELLVEDQPVQSAELQIVVPESNRGRVQDVLVNGTVVEANNRRRTVSGVTVYFLTSGITVDEFLDDLEDTQIYATGVTDRDGFYQLDRRLTPGEFYGVVIYKEGYRLVTVDDYQIDPKATSPWSIDVTLERR